MASRPPATPKSPGFITAPSTPITPTGSWRHPLMDEVSRRQAESTFTDASFFKVTYNLVALAASFVVLSLLSTNDTALSIASMFPDILLGYAIYAVWAVRLVFVYNVGDILWRLLRPADDFSDVSLTPEQRRLLGLSPNTPLTPAAAARGKFVTPPRYSKSTPTSRSASPLPVGTPPTLQRKATLGSSILGHSFSSSLPPIGSPSPFNSSPLRMGAVGGGGGPGRLVWGSPRSPKPPVGASASSVTPSNRWAYEKNILVRKGDPSRLSPTKGISSPRPQA